MSFVACAKNTSSTVNHIGWCCLDRASTHSSYTPAITLSAWGGYGSELNHIGAIACQQRQIQGQRHIEGDMVFFTKDSTGALGEAFRIYANKTARFASNSAINVNLDVGVGAASSLAKAHVNHEGSTGSLQLEARWRNQSFLSFDTTYDHGYIFFQVKNEYYMHCGNNLVYFYETTSNVSGDRLKANEIIIESACETLSK